MELQIRLATLADIPRLEELIRESVNGLSGKHYTPSQIESALSHVFGVDTQLILDATYYVATIEQELVGSGGWSKRKTLFGGDQTKADQVDELLDPNSDAARIRAFYVHPRWSRKGVGSRILTACELSARLAGFSRIELVATLPGEPLYTARGFEKAEAMQLETPDGESLPAFRMTKSL
ncbi:MAG TPA: GNAT family N-acetyltransferase [Pyrinomonadaceae bacterium]|jgi:N-acetylglutamate synthase-like GNAT family acetyltransferase|nr:GNAT family N-acetyltransferase [Pyrinomonadaceae bacterium]